MRISVLLMLLSCSVAVSHAQEQERISITGYLPPLPSESGSGPNYTLCEEPWAAMAGDDGIHASVWYCRPANHTCFSIIGDDKGYGCHGGILEGWALSDRTGTLENDYRAEIVAQVVDPCILSNARRSGLTEYMSDVEALATMKAMQMDVVETTVEALMPLVVGQPESMRDTLYEVSLGVCITAGVEATR